MNTHAASHVYQYSWVRDSDSRGALRLIALAGDAAGQGRVREALDVRRRLHAPAFRLVQAALHAHHNRATGHYDYHEEFELPRVPRAAPGRDVPRGEAGTQHGLVLGRELLNTNVVGAIRYASGGVRRGRDQRRRPSARPHARASPPHQGDRPRHRGANAVDLYIGTPPPIGDHRDGTKVHTGKNGWSLINAICFARRTEWGHPKTKFPSLSLWAHVPWCGQPNSSCQTSPPMPVIWSPIPAHLFPCARDRRLMACQKFIRCSSARS